jgi:lipid A disaccharide synthetase
VLGAAVAAAAASTDSLELAVAKTPVVVAGELGGADGKKKKKKRGH